MQIPGDERPLKLDPATSPASPGKTAPGSSNSTNSTATADGTSPAKSPDNAAEVVEKKVPLPDDAAQQKALQQLKDVLKADFADAKTLESQLALAHKLQKLAIDTKHDPGSKYVMLSQALELAIKCSDVALATGLIDALDKSFETDVWDLRQKTFGQLAHAAKTADDRAAIAKSALELAEQALPASHADTAVALSATALNLAAAAKDTGLRDQARELGERAKRLQKEQPAYDAAVAKLKTAPDDVGANLIVGRVKCFLLEDWPGGLPFLAKGGDEALTALAKQELANSTDAEQQVKLADGWWDQSDKKSDRKDDPVLKSLHARAMYWYRLAAPNLSGLLAARVQKRIDGEEATKPDAPITETAYLDDLPDQNPMMANQDLGKHGETGYERNNPRGPGGGGGRRGRGMQGPGAPNLPRKVALAGVEAQHALSLQPQANGSATVGYAMEGKYRLFTGVAAIMDGSNQQCAVMFRVLADGKVIWSSKPMYRSGDAQKFSLRIAKAQLLQLEILCKGANAGALTAWINPAVGR